MTYIRFETPQAKYIFAPITHSPISRAITPHPEADAFVLEGILHNNPNRDMGFFYDRLNMNIIQHARQNRKPIFQLDLTDKLLHPRNLARTALGITAAMGNFLTPISNSSTNEFGPVRETLRQLVSRSKMAVGTPIGNMRSAIAADRIVNQVVTMMRRETGKKPTIFIAYGLGHSDLPEFLKNHAMRRRFLARFTPISRYFHQGFETRTIRRYDLLKDAFDRGLHLPEVQPGHKRREWELDNVGTVVRTIIPSQLPSYGKRTIAKRLKSGFRLARQKLSRKK